MGNISWVPRINITKTISATPTISAAAYASGNQIGGIMTLANAVRQDSNIGVGTSMVCAVTVLDKAAASAAIDIFFFNQSPTLVSTNNTAFNLTDANLVAQCIGVASIGTAYSASSSNSVSTTANLNIPLEIPFTASANTSVFAVAVARAAATYASTSDLTFQFTLYID